MFIFPAVIAILVGFIGLRFGNDSPEAYGLGSVEELFDEEISDEDIDAEKNNMSEKELFVKYILKKGDLTTATLFCKNFLIYRTYRY